jgi:hypothetical protein
MVDVHGLRGSSAAHCVAESQRLCPEHGIPIRKVFTPVYHTLRDTGMLPGVHVPVESEVKRDADDKSKLHIHW